MLQLLMEIQCLYEAKLPKQIQRILGAQHQQFDIIYSISLGSTTCALQAPPQNMEQGGMLCRFEGHFLPTTSSF